MDSHCFTTPLHLMHGDAQRCKCTSNYAISKPARHCKHVNGDLSATAIGYLLRGLRSSACGPVPDGGAAGMHTQAGRRQKKERKKKPGQAMHNRKNEESECFRHGIGHKSSKSDCMHAADLINRGNCCLCCK